MRSGRVFAIGGREDKTGEREILGAVAGALGGAPLVVITAASEHAQELWAEYDKVFRALGVRQVTHIDVVQREDADDPRHAEALKQAGGVFFTGGDQLKLTMKIDGSSLADAVRALHARGGVLGGTSAGASVMSETMLVGGAGDETPRARAPVRMAPGLGFVHDVVIDQHFAQRGRIGRLLAAIAHNPRMLGVGIDEDTAAVIDGPALRVLGSGAVYVIDAHGLTYTNLGGEDDASHVLSVFDVRLHVLSAGDAFDLTSRRPTPRS